MIENYTKPKLAYSVREAAEATSLSERYIRGVVTTGKLKSVTIGRRRVIPADALRAFISKGVRS